MAHQALVMAAKGVVVYTLALHQALVSQGRAREGQAADTHTSWIQFHGTGVRPALTALGGNLLCRSEDNKGKAAPEQNMKTNFETVVGRGVYTRGFLEKACNLLRSIAVPRSEVADSVCLVGRDSR